MDIRGDLRRSAPAIALLSDSQPWLNASSAVLVALPFTPVAAMLGFVPLPSQFFWRLILRRRGVLGVIDTVDHLVMANPYSECISPHTASHPEWGIFILLIQHHRMEKIMDTREVQAQGAVKVSERIAANTASRVALMEKAVPLGILDSRAMSLPPRISEDRSACIAEAAYFLAQCRGFSPGHELDDWLTAENEVDARLIGERYAC
jgi:Protein of unknown function (DUF2934)